jgi:glycosyltransferase involved in cell wall biosynthesis
MRLLFVNNYFPPHYVGGYELLCGRAANWLASAGCRVRVLTSAFRNNAGPVFAARPGVEIFRQLRLRYWTDITDLGYWIREWRDVSCFRRHLGEFRPDIVVLWNMHKLASGIILEAQRLAPMLVYQLMDDWILGFLKGNGLPQFWARPARSGWGRLAKPVLRLLYRAFFTADAANWHPRNAVLVSKELGELLAKHDIRFERTHLSATTYDPALFAPNPARDAAARGAPVRFLWAGRMCKAKGLLTTINALDKLWREHPEGWFLDVCGPIDEAMREGLRPRVEQAPWRERVRYLGPIAHDEMPEQYRNHDVFLFTSEVHEGLPGTIIEAFASGLAVIGTLTGGTRDVLRPNENCLTYPPGDSEALADAMIRLINDDALRHRLATGVSEYAKENFSNDVVFSRLLEFYRELVAEGAGASQRVHPAVANRSKRRT